MFAIALFSETEPPLVNIGSGKDSTIEELAHIIRDIVGYTGEIVWDSSKPDGTMQKLLDVSKARNAGWSSSIPLGDGLKIAYQDYLDNNQ